MQKVSPALAPQSRTVRRPLRSRNFHGRTRRDFTGLNMLIALFFICIMSTKFNIMLLYQSISAQEEAMESSDPSPMKLYNGEEHQPALRQASPSPVESVALMNESSVPTSLANSSLPQSQTNSSSLPEPQKNESLLSEVNRTEPTSVLPVMGAIQLSCFQERDHGLINALRESAMTFCGNESDGNASTTKVTLFNAPGSVRATLFSSLSMDFRQARVSRSIASLARDGGNHDPRFELRPDLIQCTCPALGEYGSGRVRAKTDWNHPHRTTYEPDPLRLWHPALANVPDRRDDLSTLCSRHSTHNSYRPHGQTNATDSPDSADLVIDSRAILMPRKDDHNPFFQVSSALNAWILMKTLEWDPSTTQVVQMDDGFPTPIDSLHHELLAPNRPMILGRELKGRRVRFHSQVLLPPFESDGPMMQDLNNNCKCFNSSLIQEFRLASLQALKATNASVAKDDGYVVVTVISRRPYSGRKVQRVWLNEDAVLQTLREVYAGKRIRFQSIDFVGLDMRQQMQLMLQSDVVIGMHGAGLVNVLWTRPNTLVVEIFPRQKRRWGFRNICQHIGCDYHEFRGGNDISTGRNDPNANDKIIPSPLFLAFFRPLLQTHLQAQGRQLQDTTSSSGMASE